MEQTGAGETVSDGRQTPIDRNKARLFSTPDLPAILNAAAWCKMVEGPRNGLLVIRTDLSAAWSRLSASVCASGRGEKPARLGGHEKWRYRYSG